MTTTYRIHGVSDDTDTCEVCGKVELKSVVMLRVLDDEGQETGELLYAGSTCGPRLLARSGKRVTSRRFRDAAAAADRVLKRATEWADEFAAITLNQYIAANHEALMRFADYNIATALANAKSHYAEVQREITIIRSGTVAGTRFAASLPTL